MNGSQPGWVHTAASIIALVVLWMVATFMLFCGVALGRRDPPPPDWARVVKIGCSIDQAGPRYRTTVWVRYQIDPDKAPDWQYLYSMREDRLRAMKDCDEWMKDAEESMRKAVDDRP